MEFCKKVVGVTMTAILRWTSLSLALAAAAPVQADATLSLHRVGTGPVLPGQQVQVALRMSNIPPATPAAGFQAFLRFNSSQMSFVSGAYTAAPFGLHILVPIIAVGPDINLAAGINTFGGQTPSSANADLVILTFQANTQCGLAEVEFRDNLPPSRLTDELGQPILPIALLDLDTIETCAADVYQSNAVDINDLLVVINNWGPCPPVPTCCLGSIDGDGAVEIDDLLEVINGWGPCP